MPRTPIIASQKLLVFQYPTFAKMTKNNMSKLAFLASTETHSCAMGKCPNVSFWSVRRSESKGDSESDGLGDRQFGNKEDT